MPASTCDAHLALPTLLRTGLGLLGLAGGCGSPATPAAAPEAGPTQPDAPIVAAQPGAWFDGEGNLTVVGTGRRLRVILSAPIIACAAGFRDAANAEEAAQRASLTFRVLSEACRPEHPAILLPEESASASPAELERSYHEVARCAAHDFDATSGWVPQVVDQSDPCPLALGLGWRLPRLPELQGLGIDERKAIAGALFDTEDRAGFGSLLLYARGAQGELTLVTLSPNAAERAPALSAARSEPLFGAALRCVREHGGSSSPIAVQPPPLPNAASCLRSLRAAKTTLKSDNPAASLPELQKLKTWVETARRVPVMLQQEATLEELRQLLSAPALQRLAQEARDERALTERYAELAESLDDTGVSEAERGRRRAEFDELRKRLSDKIVKSAVATRGDRTALSALLSLLASMLESSSAPQVKPAKKPPRPRPPNHASVVAQVRELQGEKASAP